MRLCQEAIDTGRTAGQAEGRTAGRASMLIDMMGAKFGPLPKWASERINKANSVQLERWGCKMLFTDSLELVFAKR